MSTPRSAHVAMMTVQLCFASWAISGKLVLAHLDPSAILAFRVAGAALGFALLALLGQELDRRRERPAWRWPRPREWLWLALYSGLGVVGNQLLYLHGLRLTTATNATVLGTAIPVLTVGIAILVGRERATVGRVVGLLVALAGVLVLARVDRFDPGEGHLRGNLFILANSLSFSLFLVFVRDVRGRYAPMQLVALLFGLAALVLVPLGAPALLAAAPALAPATWWTLLFIVAVPTLGAYGLNQYALRHAEASVVAIYIYVQPVIVAALAAWILDERPTWRTAVAAALIFSGVALATWRDRQPT